MNPSRRLLASWNAWLFPERGPVAWWVEAAWICIYAAVCAAGFTVIGVALGAPHRAADPHVWWEWLKINAVISLTITLTTRLLFAVTARALGRRRLREMAKPWRSLYYWLVPLAGVTIGWPLGLRWAYGVDVLPAIAAAGRGEFVAALALLVLVVAIFRQFFAMKARELQAEQRVTEARLRLLQAQIEPHFLFNTLANVVSLIEADAPRAKAMLESFVDYLRASLSGLGDRHTLGDEIDLVDAYMRIVKTRMEDRLDYAIDVAPALRALPLPALTLQPLVENAVVHGLEPLVRGGRITIRAERDARSLVLTVDDDGRGLDAKVERPSGRRAQGAGTALANIRARLAQTYGEEARLVVEASSPRGVRASLQLPLPA